MTDFPCVFKGFGIVQAALIQNILPVRKAVTVMDEPHVDIIHAKKVQHIMKSCLHFRKVPRSQVLPIFHTEHKCP